MLFHSSQFLGFFVVVLLVYWLLPRHRWRLAWLLLASCAFYMSWNPWLITLILFSASVDFGVALLLPAAASPARRLLLAFSVGTNLGLLAFFKYTNFLLGSACAALNWFGAPLSWAELNLVLPLGISFYTFETISYIVDVYQGKIMPVRNPLDYALYIMFFPHLIAGPIVRPREFLPQLARPKRFNWDRVQLGLQFFLLGLFKKAVIADRVQAAVVPVFKEPGAYATPAVWLAVLAFAVEVYCDFSGYSDMAVGTAHLFGYRLPRNFRLPYLATSVVDLWRRWHISLSNWLRDYLYHPLGGSRGGKLRTAFNQVVTMTVCGLWHGANWNFVLWGTFHGVLLAGHRLVRWPRWCSAAWFQPVAVVGTFLCFCGGLVIFRTPSLADAVVMFQRLAVPLPGAVLAPALMTTTAALVALVLLGHVVAAALPWTRWERRLPGEVVGAALAALLVAALLWRPEDGASFMYFQF
jgi:alginate O-acetyltransferase complex protein AlgI